MKRCSSCGFENEDNAKYCSACGSQMPVMPTPQTNQQPSGYCQYCGQPVSSNSAFCPSCHRRVRPDTNEEWEQRHRQEVKENKQYVKMNKDVYDDGKIKGAGLGFLITFFAGFIGFIICMCLGNRSCKKGAGITFAISVIIKIVIFVFNMYLTVQYGNSYCALLF